jgi:double-stranded uracil-DNA glycosylase
VPAAARGTTADVSSSTRSAAGGSGRAPAAPERPSRDRLQAAYGAVVPDLVRDGTAVLLCGINPSLWSGAVGHHFASPSNRLWPTLHAAGWTSRRLHPAETEAVLDAGLGVTNLVPRATARADELADDELRDGLAGVTALADQHRVGWVAFLGLGAYRTATGERTAAVGPQERRTGRASTWLLPNPSGLNASWQLPRLAAAYAELRSAAGVPECRPPG